MAPETLGPKARRILRRDLWVTLAPTVPGRVELDAMLRRLDDTESAVNQIPTPLAHAENLYFFREHVDVVRRRILRRLSDGPDAARPGATALGS